MFSRVSLPDQGWKVQCRGKGICRHVNISALDEAGTDHTDEVRRKQPITISSITPLFILQSISFKHGGVWNGYTGPCIDLWDGPFVLNTDAKKIPGISYVRDTYHHHSITIGWETLLHKLTQNPGGTHCKGAGFSYHPQFESVKSPSLLYMSNTWLTKTELCINE